MGVALTDYSEKVSEEVWFLLISGAMLIGSLFVLLEGYHLYLGDQKDQGLATIILTLVGLAIFFAFQFIRTRAKGEDGSVSQKLYIALGVDTVQENSLAFFAGFLGWYGLLAGKSFSVLEQALSVIPALPMSALFSSATEHITDPAVELYANTILFPYIEEGFFLAAVPLLILLVLDKLGESISLLNNLAVRLGILVVTTGALFASFHVTAVAFSSFWIAAFGFRAIQMGLTYGDMSFNVVPRFAVLFPFAIGAHIANNIYVSGGIHEFVTVISGHSVLAWTTLVVFGIYAFWAVEGLVQILSPVWKRLGDKKRVTQRAWR